MPTATKIAPDIVPAKAEKTCCILSGIAVRNFGLSLNPYL
ncbi:hypothetical protein QEW_3536 [Clostridioides difficile CD160]|nr:hypothetical protein QEW_3536 [Clostridioides difficile CD160]